MGWAISYDDKWRRDVGYGVIAYCDEPECYKKIDRGLAYVCTDNEPYGGDNGCGLFFCEKHRFQSEWLGPDKCPHVGYSAKSDHPIWIRHKLSDPSWAEWRAENQEWIAANKLDCD